MRRLRHHFPVLVTGRFSFVRLANLILAYSVLILGLSAVSGKSVSASADVADVADDSGVIPGDAIRIRILANSDSDFDQQVKRSVRDRVESEIVSWGRMPGTHREARSFIESHLDDAQAAANDVLADWNAPYGAKVELKKVPFPDKTFKGREYPAGEYEALRITLGGGAGANWWCVLFPPLCLTAATAPDEPPAETAAATKSSAKAGGADAGKRSVSASKGAVSGPSGGKADVRAAAAGERIGDGPKPKFFLAELLGQFGKFLKSLFS